MSKKIKHILLIIFFAGLEIPGMAQLDTVQFSEILSEAMENNFGVRIARNSALVAGNNNTPGNAGFLPVLNLTGSDGKSNSNTKLVFSDPSRAPVERNGAGSSSVNALAELDWTVFDGLRMFATRQKLAELENQGQLSVRMQMETLYVGLAALYYQLSQQEKLRQVLVSSMNISRARLSLAEKKFQVGAASELDLNQAKVDYSSDSTLLIDQTLVIRNLLADINAFAGRSPEIIFAAGHDFDLNYSMQYNPLKEKLQAQNSDLLLARSQMDVYYQQIREARSNFFPRFTVYGNYNYVKSQSDVGVLTTNQSKGYGYGFRFSYNLFDGMNKRRELENAKIEYNSSELNSQQVLIQSEAGLLKSYNGYQSALQEISLERENLQTTRKNLKIAVEKYRLGAINEIDFRNIQQNALESEGRLLTAEYLAKIAEISMLQLSGGLSL